MYHAHSGLNLAFLYLMHSCVCSYIISAIEKSISEWAALTPMQETLQ